MLFAGFLPYPDPRRRRVARRAARELISRAPWPGDDATPIEIAQLALLRLLWLQREAHRCRRRQAELLAFLARAAVETCITGLYWIYGEDHIDRARGDNAKSFRRLMSPLADGDPITPELVNEVAATIGSGTDLPNLLARAELVTEKSGNANAEDLYRRLYIPLSTFVAHPSGMALLRHVNADDGLIEVPSSIWTARAARHALDACMAILAVEIAEQTKRPAAVLNVYGNAHMERTIAPLAIFLGGAVWRNLRPTRIVRTMRPMAGLWRYYRSGRAALDDYPSRKKKTSRALATILESLGGDRSSSEEVIVEHFAKDLARSVEAEKGEGIEPS